MLVILVNYSILSREDTAVVFEIIFLDNNLLAFRTFCQSECCCGRLVQVVSSNN